MSRAEDSRRLDWLEEVAREVEVKISTNENQLFAVEIGRVPVYGATLREALDTALGAGV